MRILTVLMGIMIVNPAVGEETLPPLKDGKAPQNFDEMWAGFDPRKEPLAVEVLKEWEEDGVVLKVLRYRIGIFKGKKAMMAAIYGYPKGGSKLPALVQIHGGGQYADYRACTSNAKRGYATISLAWSGRMNAPGYLVDQEGVKGFWAGKTDDPAYKITTDWGALDAYHASSRNPVDAFTHMNPYPWTLDEVESCRNNGWFLCTVAARRALTFLEQQPEVDGDRIGVYGHSMGGRLSVMTAAADSRIKAAAPSCGGITNFQPGNPLHDNTICSKASLPYVSCPIVFLNPANDFHSVIDDLPDAVRAIKSMDWRVTCSPHANHQDTAEYEVATQLWFDHVLKKTFEMPRTPESWLTLETPDGIPSFSVIPDLSREILSVDIFYTMHGLTGKDHLDMENNINRFWHHARAQKTGDRWTSPLPILSTDKPLWAYANVLYPLAEPVTGAGYYYGKYIATSFNLSSVMSMASPAQLKKAGVKATMKPSLVIEDFKQDWKKEWFSYSNDPKDWQRKTHKLYDEKYQAPASAWLVFELRSEKPNKLVLGLDQGAAEIKLKGGVKWQKVVLYPTDFKDADGNMRIDWKGVKELRLSQSEVLKPKTGDKPIKLGAEWKGAPPEFRSLRWAEEPGRN